MTFQFRALPRALAAASLCALAACQNEFPPPAAVETVGESQFSGTVGETIGSPVTVKVTDAKGKALGGIPVTFVVTEGGGTVSKATDTSTTAGVASTVWRLGERAGTQRLTAMVAGLAEEIIFSATARPAAPASIAVNGGNQQTVVVGTAVLTAPSVVIRDRFNNPVPGVSVVFTVASGGGTVTGGAATTNAVGVAAVTEWRLGSAVGTNTLSALALASGITGNPVTFTATGTAGAAAAITAVGSAPASATVATAVSPVPQVRVADASGNPVAGVAVTFTGSSGSVVTPDRVTTDANGLAAPTSWTLGSVAGNYTLTTAAGTVAGPTFTVIGRADVAATMTKQAGDAQTAQVGRAVATEPAVRVVDRHGNPVAGVEVVFEVSSGGGAAVGRRATTNAQGIATVGGWTLGETAGTNQLVASVPGTSVAAVTFSATATAGAAATMAISAGQNQTAQAGAAVTVPPAVVVRDARGNVVAGAVVTFSIGTGGGTVTGAVDTTNASGIAEVGTWTLGNQVGTQMLVARSTGVAEVTFTATATAGAPARISAFSTTSQTGIVAGAALTLSQRPAVRVTDAEGNPVSGATVTFRVAQDSTSGLLAGGDTVNRVVTNANGLATVAGWTAPTTAGVTATARASVTGVADTVSFTVSTIAGPVARLRISNGLLSTLSAVAGVASPVTISARDANNNLVTSYTGEKQLRFSGPGLSPTSDAPKAAGINMGTATPVTFTAGEATVSLILVRAETTPITVTDGTITSALNTFTATVAAAAAASNATSTVAAATTTMLTNGSTTITVTVKDVFGNLRTNTAASAFAASATVGTLGAFTCTNGVCTAAYTAPGTAGSTTITVTISSAAVVGSPLTITYTAAPPI